MATRRTFVTNALLSLTGLSGFACGHECGELPIPRDGRYRNWLGTRTHRATHRALPNCLGDLVAIVQWAERAGTTVRAMGAGHSVSDVAMTDGVLVFTDELDSALDLEPTMTRTQGSHLFRAESGASIRALNEVLWGDGFAFQNLGGYDAQSIVGAVSTGTHGTGLGYGPIASQIASMVVVASGGRVLRVEPSNGITEGFAGRVSTRNGDVEAELIQDDATFNAALVSMGCMGLIYSATVKVDPRYWLRETRVRTTWSELTAPDGFITRLLRDPTDIADESGTPSYYDVSLNPYEVGGEYGCLLTRRYRLETRPATSRCRRRGRAWGRLVSDAGVALGGGAPVAEFLSRFPRRAPRALDRALNAIVDDCYADRAYRVHHLGNLNELAAYGLAFGLPIGDTARFVDELCAQARQELRDRRRPHSSPVSLRFVARSDALLAMQHGRNTLMVEMPMLVGVDRGEALLRHYMRHFVDEFSARPHWGLDLDHLRGTESVRRLYPDTFDAWLDVYQSMNATGVFNSPFTQRLGISV